MNMQNTDTYERILYMIFIYNNSYIYIKVAYSRSKPPAKTQPEPFKNRPAKTSSG